MINRITTRQLLEISFNDLIVRYPFNKITVSAICDNCRVSRQTFYYYFKDKYDLVNNIYEKNANNIVYNQIGRPWKGVLHDILKYLAANKKHYMEAFNIEGQNSFSSFLIKYTYNMYCNIINLHAGGKTLSKSQRFSLEFYCHGAVCMAKIWAKKYMDESTEFIAERLNANIPIDIVSYFR